MTPEMERAYALAKQADAVWLAAISSVAYFRGPKRRWNRKWREVTQMERVAHTDSGLAWTMFTELRDEFEDRAYGV